MTHDSNPIQSAPSFPGLIGLDRLWVDPIPPWIRAEAIEAFDGGDAWGFLCMAGDEYRMEMVFRNSPALMARGLYEAALLWAYTTVLLNHRNVPRQSVKHLFRLADRGRLRAAGDPLPGPGPFTVYRGVAGRGPARRVRGFSWTTSVERAWWFAHRYAERLSDPAVFCVTVSESAVLAYTNNRTEQEFLVWIPPDCRPQRVEPGDSAGQAGIEPGLKGGGGP